MSSFHFFCFDKHPGKKQHRGGKRFLAYNATSYRQQLKHLVTSYPVKSKENNCPCLLAQYSASLFCSSTAQGTGHEMGMLKVRTDFPVLSNNQDSPLRQAHRPI